MKQELIEIALDFSEIALDRLIENELLKEIPIVGTLVRAAKAAKSIPDLIFAKKIERFVAAGNRVSPEKKEALLKSLQTDSEMGRKAGECIVLMLDRADDLTKASIIGELFVKLLERSISLEEFRRLTAAVDRSFVDDLLLFPEWALHGKTRGFDPRRLDGTGLVERVYPNLGELPINSVAEPSYGYSKIGLKYAKALLGFSPVLNIQ
jgi:hypothetical protein